MHFTATSIAGFLLALRPVAADFSVFTIQDNPATDADVQTNGFKFFNNPPDCDDINNSVPWINGWNDASDGGAACDGCDGGKNVLDWDVTRFEINDNTNDYFAGPHDNMHMTLYKDEASGGYGLYDDDMTSLGNCERPADPQYYECADLLSAGSGYQLFRCYAAVTIKDSN